MFRSCIDTILSLHPHSLSTKIVMDDGVQRYVNDDTSGVVRVHSDPYFLLNNLSPSQDSHLTDKWLESLTDNVSDDLMSKIPKDEVSNFVKSRYIQSPSELKNHLLSLMERSDELRERASIRAEIDESLSHLNSNVNEESVE